MPKELNKFIIVFCLFSLFLPFSFAEAQEARPLEVEYPPVPGAPRPVTVETGLTDYVRYLFNFGVIIVGLILLGALIYGGIRYLTSAGNLAALADAKDRILAAFLGVIILLSSYIILTTINPQLVIFELPAWSELPGKRVALPEPIGAEEVSLISKELPLGQVIEKNVWEKSRPDRINSLVEEIESFLNQEIKIDNQNYGKIASLNKYLKTLTEECQCGELNTFCAKPGAGAGKIGASGDPCPEGIREMMGKVFKVNEEKMKELLEFRPSIIKEKISLETELSKFAEIEHEVLSCQTQAKGLSNLNEYLSLAQFYEEQGSKTIVKRMEGYPEARADPLTFYCSIGGTAFDYPYYLPEIEFSPEELTGIEVPEEITWPEPLSCLAEFPVGNVTDQLRELAVLTLIKMDRLVILIDEMVTEVRNMADLASQCNEQGCQDVNCSCIPNPLFPLFSWSPCLQAVGLSTGSPCPREELQETSEKIKEIEDEIFLTLREIKQIFPKVSFILADEENPLNLNNIRTAVGLCSGPQTEEGPLWAMLNCEMAIGNYGPDGQIINNCHPRNFYCCSGLKEALLQPPDFSPAVKEPQPYILPEKKYEPLAAAEDNCPEGWLCSRDITYYNQYQDASQPLKELLSCMRERLDKTQEEKEIEDILGRITSISDSRLYDGDCSWESGPENPGDCSHTYEIRDGRERVSAHYGGTMCRYQRASYALDIGVNLYLYERKYADEVIKAAKECSPSSLVLHRTPGHYDHIHIGIGANYQCGGN